MTTPTPHKGLTDLEVEASRRQHGTNVLTPPARESVWRLYIEKFQDPLIVILMVIGVFAVGVSSYEYWGLGEGGHVFFEPIGIFAAILLATGLGFYFELKAQNEFTVLNHENDREPVAVVRNGHVTEIPKCDVVVGDLLVLQTGQEIPADAILVEAVSLVVDESSLTGEPAHRKSVTADATSGATYPTDHVYRGTEVMEGHGLARVLAVGDKTENGKVMQSLTGLDLQAIEEAESQGRLDDTQRRAVRLHERSIVTQKVKTPLNEQLDRLSRLITTLSYIAAGAIIVGRLLVYFDWKPQAWLPAVPTTLFFWLVIRRFPRMSRWQCTGAIAAFFALLIGGVAWLHHLLLPGTEMSHLLAFALNTIMVAVTLVVVSVPEGLPMAVSLALANSMRKMLRTNNLVRKMHACETMGATTVICTDKTGTLTQNQMQVKATLLAEEAIVYEGMATNSTASVEVRDGHTKTIGNPTEGALLLYLGEKGIDYRTLRQEAHTVAELPFTTERKYMATLVDSHVLPGKRVLYVKGAPEIVLSLCDDMAGDLTAEQTEATLHHYQQHAMRTLAFAYKVVDEGTGTISPEGLTFLGVVGIEDPVRPDVAQAIARCLHAGIAVKVVTGDTSETAREIARRVGIWTDCDGERNITDGRTLAAMSHDELLARCDELKVVARARPMDKKRLIEALMEKGHVVAATGDGTNDAPALHAAHVGLSMGTGTSVAKEASDITIIDDSFASIARAVKWGRSLYQNIQRFLLFQLTVNVAASLLVLCGAFMSTQSPLTVTQMLWVNLIMDTFAAFALSALPPTDHVMDAPPRDRRAFILDKDMMGNILGVGLFFFVLLFSLLYIFQHAEVTQLTDLLHLRLGAKRDVTPYELTLLFTIFVMAHFWYLFNARAYKSGGSGLELNGCHEFLAIAALTFFGQVAIVEMPLLNDFFNVVPLKAADWLAIVVLTSLVLVVREGYSRLKALN